MAAFHRGYIPVLGTLVIYACSSSAPKSGVSGGASAGGQTATAGAAGTIAGDAGAGTGTAGATDVGTAGAIDGTAGAAPIDAAGVTDVGTSTDGATFPIGDPGTVGDGDLTISPPYTTQPDLTDKGNPKGKSFHFTMSSAGSQIFKGDDTTLLPANQHTFMRGVDVYVPALHQDGTPAPLLVIQDGPGELGLVKNALDNLTISKDPTRKLPDNVLEKLRA